MNSNIDSLGFCSVEYADRRILTFIENSKFINILKSNNSIKAVITTKELWNIIKKDKEDIGCIISLHPKYDFFKIHNLDLKLNIHESKRIDHIIASNVEIHPTVLIENPVQIEKNVCIGPYSIIKKYSIIKSNTVIGSHCVIGDDGFQYVRAQNDVLKVKHYGHVIIGKNVELKSHVTIDRSLMHRSTEIGDFTKIDKHAHIGHGCLIGRRVFIGAHAVCPGNVQIGDDIWVGSNSVFRNRIKIGNKSFISLGSVVTSDCNEGSHLTGNFAIDHNLFINNLKKRNNVIQE